MNVSKESIAARLEDPSPEVRRRAVRELAQIAPEQAGELVLAALGDEDWRVRKETILIVADLELGEDLVEALIDAMEQEDDVGLRNGASEALAGARVDVVTPLSARLPRMNASGRKIALEVIGRTEDPRAVPTLVEHLGNEDANIRVCAAELLGDHSGKESAEALAGCLSGDDSLLTLAALQSLNKMGAKVGWASLEPLVDQPIFGSEILFAMARSSEPSAAAPIVDKLQRNPSAARCLEILHGTSAEAARAVEEALTAAGDEILEALSGIADDEESENRRAAVRNLIWSRDTARVETLISLSGDEALHRIIVDGLMEWGQPALEEIERILPRVTGRTLVSVVGLLGKMLSDEEGPAKAALFTAYLNSTDEMVATAAAGAIARFGDVAVLPRLMELAGHEERRVRRAAGYAMAQIGLRHPEDVREAISALEVEGPAGIELCRVFEAVGRPEDLGIIARALSSPDPELRKTALGTLASVAGSAAVDTISLSMTDEDVGVRMAAASALARIGPAAAETIVSAIHTARGPLKTALVRALGMVGHFEAQSILSSMCEGSADLAMAALEAMQNLGLDPGEMKQEILGHRDPEVIKKALIFLGPQISLDELEGLLGHPQWDVRLAAVDRLSSSPMDNDAVVALLSARFAREDDDLVRASISRALQARKNGGAR